MTKGLIALIAEDETDCDTVREIVHRVLGKGTGTKRWASKGCSTLKKGLSARLATLSKAGCHAFIIVHDLDRNPANGVLNDEEKLRTLLDTKVKGFDPHVICIPVEELEAWFWADPGVIKQVGRGKGEASVNPHLIKQPKEKLRQLSIDHKQKPRYSNNMNAELAKTLNLDLCAERCPSFKALYDFLNKLKKPKSPNPQERTIS